MSQQEPQSPRKTLTVSRTLPDGGLVELVHGEEKGRTCLALFRDGVLSVEDEIVLLGGETLVPIPATNNLIRHRAVLLPGRPEVFGTAEDLAGEIDAYLFRYVDLSESFRRIATQYILLTWVYDAFNELPYLRLRGDFGAGKTRALIAIGSVCYKAFFASGASTVSPIFHTLDTFRGTLIFDEADFRFTDEKSELVKIFNNGNVKGFPVLRTAITLKREFDPRAFNVFGPKIVAMRKSFEDYALESRFITEEMGGRKLRDDIPINLPERQAEEAAALRNKLLQYRFETLNDVRLREELRDRALSPRLNQILLPLLSITDSEETRQTIREAVRFFDHDLYAERASSSEAELLEVLADLMGTEDRSGVPVGEITSSFISRFGAEHERPITNRYVGNLLRKRLRLSTYKSHGVYVVPATQRERIDILCGRYGVRNPAP